MKAIGANAQSDWSNLIEVTLADAQQWQLGDVNRDGQVNVSDVTYLINMILSIVPMDKEAADINSDNAVNVSDVTALINIILGLNN